MLYSAAWIRDSKNSISMKTTTMRQHTHTHTATHIIIQVKSTKYQTSIVCSRFQISCFAFFALILILRANWMRHEIFHTYFISIFHFSFRFLIVVAVVATDFTPFNTNYPPLIPKDSKRVFIFIRIDNIHFAWKFNLKIFRCVHKYSLNIGWRDFSFLYLCVSICFLWESMKLDGRNHVC